MTRYTNLGYKRTYVEASKLDDNPAAAPSPGEGANGTGEEPKKKNTHRAGKKWTMKRKRAAGEVDEKDEVGAGEEADGERPKKKRRIGAGAGAEEDATTGDQEGKENQENAPVDGDRAPTGQDGAPTGQKTKASKPKKKFERNKGAKDAKARALASEQRRLARIAERQSHTICFACRKPGHSIKDCPSAAASAPTEGKVALRGEAICYRCGSTQHTLSRCRKPELPGGELPYAKCFVCNGTGHLAGQCERNERGVYPKGGKCKVCGEVTHLAKDCPLRAEDAKADTLVLGVAGDGGDEDDFHVLKRRKAEVDKEFAATAKPVPEVKKPKKVVKF